MLIAYGKIDAGKIPSSVRGFFMGRNPVVR
jgi:hypothetical protein